MVKINLCVSVKIINIFNNNMWPSEFLITIQFKKENSSQILTMIILAVIVFYYYYFNPTIF